LKFEGEIGRKATLKFMKDNTKQELIESTKFTDETDITERLDRINEEFVKWLHGEEFICVPAVYCVIRALEKVVYMINLSKCLLETKDVSKNRKLFILMAYRLSRLFDLLYAAALDDKDSIFY
jgi:hypothetical protein